MDHIGAQYIDAESFSDDRLGGAIMNRMIKGSWLSFDSCIDIKIHPNI